MQVLISVDKVMEQLNSHALLVRMGNNITTSENNPSVSLKSIHIYTMKLSNSIFRYLFSFQIFIQEN